jgi:hypothetical protein
MRTGRGNPDKIAVCQIVVRYAGKTVYLNLGHFFSAAPSLVLLSLQSTELSDFSFADDNSTVTDTDIDTLAHIYEFSNEPGAREALHEPKMMRGWWGARR